MHTDLDERSSFRVATAVAGVGLWTSAAPSLTYPLYARTWDLGPAVTTAVFAVFPLALIVVLLLANDLPDRIGFRAAILAGLGCSALGAVLFAAAPSIGIVFVARALCGVGVALSMSSATAVQVATSGTGGAARASTTNTVATAIGVVAAALVGGSLIEYAPLPARLTFVVLAVVCGALLVPAWFLPVGLGQRYVEATWRPRWPSLGRDARSTTAVAIAAVAAGYALGALMFSLGAQIGHTLLDTSNVLVQGATIAVFAVAIAAVAVAARRVPAVRAVAGGAAATVVGLSGLLVASWTHLIAVFFPAAVLLGAGYSLLVVGGLSLLTAAAAPADHSARLSAMYLLAYLAQVITSLGLGTLAGHVGLSDAVTTGAVVLAVAAVAAAAATATARGMRTVPAVGPT